MYGKKESLQKFSCLQKSNQVSVPVYCECRQLESEKMVQCDQCQHWFDNDYVTVHSII